MTPDLPRAAVAALGEPSGVRVLASSPRSHVWQVSYPGRQVIVKRITGGPGADLRTPAERFAREVTALGLAGTAPDAATCALLGQDETAHVLILEHLPDEPPGPDWPIRYAESLARLHAAAVRHTPGLPSWQPPSEQDAQAFLALAGALGVPIPPGTPAELRDLLGRLSERPQPQALLHGDPCPDNSRYSGGRVRFVDLEQASLGNGLVELAYLRAAFPTCWCAMDIREPTLSEAEAAYRATWHALTGAHVTGDLADACAGWLLRGDSLVERARRGTADHLAALVTTDWEWGTATARERLAHRLARATTTPSPHLRAFTALCTAMRRALHTNHPTLRPLPATRPY
ncbi:hypothetical protein HNP84_007794 [Thermocatellispora tengchongensis]|uniref:Aminoglycoside phosphotransferase domain-containing protein n=1 Tax=Thermocatellispora tengchongensis TaxID=1073253 RepID=A0A840PJP9_9ACTN|nr:phosphotransferase [Thermocatellispora tengchongensis]MBB5138041.1 hypothetical protein [Thermocatellispora tengchongensis]